MDKIKYMCQSEEKPAYDHEGKEIGVDRKRVLCYNVSVGRKRIYRVGFLEIAKGMRILFFEKEANAQDLCDTINKEYNDDFKPVPATR